VFWVDINSVVMASVSLPLHFAQQFVCQTNKLRYFNSLEMSTDKGCRILHYCSAFSDL